ncbi:MAG: two-component system NtrC family sensor kinase [Glaciecola sp.]|jgi:two-component system NtrC family sensor kinase
MHISLRNKTILGIAAIEAALLVLLIFTAVNFMRNTLSDGLVKRASTVATLFASATKGSVLSYDLASLEAYCAELMKNPDIAYIRVLNSEAQVLAEAGREDLLSVQFIADEQLKSVTDGVFDSFAVISESDHIYGQVQIGIDITNIEKSIMKIQSWTSGIALIEMLLVALFSFVLGTYLTRQLQGLTNAAKETSKNVASGEFTNTEIVVNGKDELAEVAQAFNKLNTTLEIEHDRQESYQKELEVFNRTLEDKVIQRTALLNKQNDQLERTNYELQEAQQQLVHAEKMVSLGQLAAGVAHEINTPIGFVTSNLNSLKQYTDAYRQLSKQVAELLSSESPESEILSKQALLKFVQSEDLTFINRDTKDLLDESIEGLERVKDIVKDLKQFSRADSDEKQLFDINDCVTTTLNMVSNELKYHCNIETHLSPLPKILINVGKISQVLTNLLINAGQAISKNGQITIRTEQQGNNVVVSIADNGSGINPENRSKLFDPFFTTKEEGGTGLGLSISYGIIQSHHGDITVTSEPNKGSCFNIILPVGENSNQVKVVSNEY